MTSPAANSVLNIASKISCASDSSRWLKRTLSAIDFSNAVFVSLSLEIT